MTSVAPLFPLAPPSAFDRSQLSVPAKLPAASPVSHSVQDAQEGTTRVWSSGRERVIARWRKGLARLSALNDTQRARYIAVVEAVGARLRRYDSIDLLVTTYFQGSDFAVEAIQSLFPHEVQVWNVFLIEDAAWGKRLTELEQATCESVSSYSCLVPTEAADLAAKGRQLLDGGDIAGALVVLQEATALAPKMVEYWEQLGSRAGARETGVGPRMRSCERSRSRPRLSVRHPSPRSRRFAAFWARSRCVPPTPPRTSS